jgi:hypothetical protein
MPRKRAATLAKPTPGPYRIVRRNDDYGYTVRAGEFNAATFWDTSIRDAGKRTARANAQAFVDGHAAIEALERIRREIETSAADNEGLVGAICAILDEEPKS